MNDMKRQRVLWVLVLAMGLLTLGSCNQQEPKKEDLFNNIVTFLVSESLAPSGDKPLPYRTNDDVEREIIDAIDGAQVSVEMAVETLQREEIAQALVRAQERGVFVRVVGDEDKNIEPGWRVLTDRENGLQRGPDGTRPYRFGDGALTYSPSPTVVVTRDGDDNRMTHNFLIIDNQVIYNLSGGFWENRDVLQVGFKASGEDLVKDFGDELNQMYGGLYSTTLSTFNGPLKSITDNREHYPTNNSDLAVFFGPQQRLMKRVIDEVYNARSSVFIVTEELTNEFLFEALRYKAMNGFTVGVVVDTEGRDVEGSRFDDLDEMFNDIRNDGDPTPSIRLLDGVRTNMVIIDADVSPINRKRYKTQAMVLSEPMVEAITFEDNNVRPVARPADAFMDANMWVLHRAEGRSDDNVAGLVQYFQQAFNEAR